MFLGLISRAPGPSVPANLSFANRRSGHDRRAAAQDTNARMMALDRTQALVELGLDGKLVNANENFANLLGETVDRLLERPYASLLAEQELQGPRYRLLAERLPRGEAVTLRLAHLGRDKRRADLRIIFTPVLGEDGRPSRLLGIACDETEMAREETQQRHAHLVVDTVSVAVMIVNRDFVVTQVNKATKDLLSRRVDDFRKVWPNFDPARIVGTCIDTFHRDASHQRRMLADTSRLPFRTDISVGELKFALNVNASYDADGVYDGNILEWMDVTELRTQQGQLAALDRASGVIEFGLDGKVLHANKIFLDLMGVTLAEIRGQHHSMFVEAAHRGTAEYRQFWEKLGRGEHDAGQYKRIGKGGREVWIQASYNPILDQNGRPFKVVKYATDITEQVRASNALSQAVQQIQDAVAAAKDNDLTRRVPLDGKTGLIESLCGGVNGLFDTMVAMIGSVSDAAGTIATAAREIAMGNTDLSQRTEQQASSLEETAASLEQLTSTVRQNADNAQQANKLASTASEVAVKGGGVVTAVVRTMDEITTASRKISDIISVIDEIAFQTNILALNAAVEAARAGEQGRGFAVVAAEVRNLAQRSANAAKEIKALISDSGAKVETGSKLVSHAGQTMEEIVVSVKRVTDIMAEISAASREQSQGIEQVNVAVSQMDKITQQNAALVEESAAAAKSMEDQTASLAAIVGAFQIGRVSAGPAQNGHGTIAVAAKVAKPVTAPAPAKAAAARKPVATRKPAATESSEEDWKEF